MGGMPVNDMPWWRWRCNVRSALHMLSDPVFQQNVWLAGVEGYGDVTDAVYRLVEDTWLDNWSAEKYVGTIFRDSQEAALVDTASEVASAAGVAVAGTVLAALFAGSIATTGWSARQTGQFQEAVLVAGLALTVAAAGLVAFGFLRTRGAGMGAGRV